MRPVIHMALHFLVPYLFARIGYAQRWKSAWLIMMAAMVIDVDHLLADPLYDPDRCGIGYHPLHSYWAIAVYVVLLAFPATRLPGLGLVIHVLLDGIDCLWLSFEI